MRNRSEESSACSTESDTDEETQLKKLHGRMCGVGKQNTNDIITRPCASPGYWLCSLLPLALCVGYWSTTVSSKSYCDDKPANYKLVTVTSICLCLQSVSFFIYLNLKANLFKWLIVFIPFICGTALFQIFYEISCAWALAWSLFIEVLYQRVYIRVMRELPMSFTYGEASILVQGIILFSVSSITTLYELVTEPTAEAPPGDLAAFNIILKNALLLVLVACILLAAFEFLRKPLIFYGLMVIFILGATLLPVTKPLPIIVVLDFIFRNSSRLYIIIFYLGVVGATVAVVCWQLGKRQNATTSVRKLFHLMVIFVYVPGLLYECTFLYIASGIALAFITLLDLLRILRMPPLGDILENAFQSFADEKDAGIIAFTPFCLLIGCSIPMWILPCPCYKDMSSGGIGVNPGLLSLLSGILTIGFGDTAASIIGFKFGRRKWKNSNRTLEGSISFLFAVLIPIILLNHFGCLPLTLLQWLLVIGATLSTALIEAHTDQVDNLVLPLVFYIIVSVPTF